MFINLVAFSGSNNQQTFQLSVPVAPALHRLLSNEKALRESLSLLLGVESKKDRGTPRRLRAFFSMVSVMGRIAGVVFRCALAVTIAIAVAVSVIIAIGVAIAAKIDVV